MLFYSPACSGTGMMHLGDQVCSFWSWEEFIALFHRVKSHALTRFVEAMRDAIRAPCRNFHLGQGGSPLRQPKFSLRLLRGCSISGNSPACQIHISFSFNASATKPYHCPSITSNSPLIKILRWASAERGKLDIVLVYSNYIELYHDNISHADNLLKIPFSSCPYLLKDKGNHCSSCACDIKRLIQDKKHLSVQILLSDY